MDKIEKKLKTKKSFFFIAFFLVTLQQTTLPQEVHSVSPPYRNIDTLKYLVLSKGDSDAYNELRFSIGTWDLVPYSEIMVHQYNYPPALINLYVAYITLFEHYGVAVPEKVRQKSNSCLKKAYMTGDFCAKTMLYVRYKNGIYIDKDTALASLIEKSDSAISLSSPDTLLFYRRKPDLGDIYTFFFVESDRVLGARIFIYNQKGRVELTYNKSNLNRIGCSDDIEKNSLADPNGEKGKDPLNSTKELESILKTIFLQHGGQINESGWWILSKELK